MPEILAGIVVSSTEVQFVLIRFQADQFVLISQGSIKVPAGDRAQAYRVVYEQFKDLLAQSKVECACVKASAISIGGTKLAHLEAAELRGVAQAAAAAVCDVRLVRKAATSRTFGSRGVDDYVKDNEFWKGHGLEAIKKGAREAAFAAISQFAS